MGKSISTNKKAFFLFNVQEGKCFYCKGEMAFPKHPNDQASHTISREHLVRKADGGKNADNIVLACRGCNNCRHDISVEKWIKIRRLLLCVWPACTFPNSRVKDLLKFAYRMWFDYKYRKEGYGDFKE